MSKQAEVFWSNSEYTVLKADHGDLDPTSDSKVGLLAGFWLVEPDGNLQHLGTDMADLVAWIKQAQKLTN